MKVLIVGKQSDSDPTISVFVLSNICMPGYVVKEVREVNADHQVVCIVEDDQGEGWKDPLDCHDLKEMSRAERKERQREFRRRSARHSMRSK